MDVKLKLLALSDNAKDWERWSKTFLANCKLREYKEVLLGTKEVKKDDSNYQEIKSLNDLAHAELLIGCEYNLCFGIIENSTIERFPDGDAALARLNLIEKYEPRTKINVIKLKKEFIERGLENFNIDPDEGLMHFERIKWKRKGMGHEISDEDMIVHILQRV